MQQVLRQMIIDSINTPVPPHTRRDIRLPAVPGKTIAVIGMRRSGKTTFLWQCLAERLAGGTPREALLFLSFEDERLAGIQSTDLQWVVEEYYRMWPEFRDKLRVCFFLDEIQVVPGWETFARRLIDTEQIDLFISGSSARLLSREVATSMRGRGLEVLVHPFSFRESLRHAGAEPDNPWHSLAKTIRSDIDHRLLDYLSAGGFPEAQGVSDVDRVILLRTFVDVAVLRDVIERHSISNPLALRWLQRHMLANPAANFSVQKFHDALRSQGIPIGKDSLYAFLGYLEDTFLIRTLSLHTASERQRMVNPRKAYPVYLGLIPVYERTGRMNLDHALETVVLLELERRGCQTDYVRTREGYEVDFLACDHQNVQTLIQVCTEISDPVIREREIRALIAATSEFPNANPVLLTLDSTPARLDLPAAFNWQPAAAWLLGDTSS